MTTYFSLAAIVLAIVVAIYLGRRNIDIEYKDLKIHIRGQNPD